MKKIVTILFIVLMFGCQIDDEIDYSYEKTFINNSSYDIIVTPCNQDWEMFIVNSGEENVLYLDYETCYFMYNYALFVNVTAEDNILTFTDK